MLGLRLHQKLPGIFQSPCVEQRTEGCFERTDFGLRSLRLNSIRELSEPGRVAVVFNGLGLLVLGFIPTLF
jgi:hypothetical protein